MFQKYFDSYDNLFGYNKLKYIFIHHIKLIICR